MKFILSILLATTIGNVTYSADSTRYITHFKLAPGISFHARLTDLNQALNVEGTSEINPFTFSTLIQGKIQKDRSAYQLSFAINNLNNREKMPETQVVYNLYHFSLSYGSDILRRFPNLRLEPFIGLGGTFGDFFIFSSDSSQSFSQINNGAQNLFYEQPSPALFGESGLRLEFAEPKKRIGYYAEFNAQQQLTNWEWKLQNMPMKRLSIIRFHLGFRFRLFGSQ